MELLEIITHFVKQSNTDFAILINGAWGSGKTHFLNQTVKKAVEQIPCKISDKKIENYKLVYISLYGLSSADELEKKLFLEVNPVLKTKVLGILGTGLQKFTQTIGFNTDTKDLVNIMGGIPKNRILVFDDLERLQPEVLNQVFGFINAYTEHQKLKVIIIADEGKIKDQITDYTSVKEKLIRFTYHYNPELSAVFPQFTMQYANEEYRQFLTAHNMLICDSFTKGEHKNLRSLRFLLDLFEPIFFTINAQANIRAEVKTLLLKRLLLFMATYTIEYKKGHSKEKMQELTIISQALNYYALGLNFFDNFEAVWQNNDEQAPAPEKTFAETFQATYFRDQREDFEYFPMLADYIHSGDLDIPELQKIAVNNQQILDEMNGSPKQIALKKLRSCLELNDDELVPLITEILGYVDQGQYKLAEYPIIFQNLVQLASNNIEGVVVNEQTAERFEAGMPLALPDSVYKHGFRNQISMEHNEDPLLKRIRDAATVLNDSLQIAEEKKFARETIDLLTPETLEDFHKKLEEDQAKSVPIFQEDHITVAEFLEKFDMLSNQQKLVVLEDLQNYSNYLVRYRSEFANEISFFERLENTLKERIAAAEQHKTLGTYILQRYLWWVSERLEKLRGLDH